MIGLPFKKSDWPLIVTPLRAQVPLDDGSYHEVSVTKLRMSVGSEGGSGSAHTLTGVQTVNKIITTLTRLHMTLGSRSLTSLSFILHRSRQSLRGKQ